MKLAKILIIFIFLLGFVLQVSAQSISYPNELDGYKFYGKGRLKNLQITVSKLETWESIFGKECSSTCDLEKDWVITFYIIDAKSPKIIIEDNVEKKFFVKPQFADTIWALKLQPKKRISFTNYRFPKAFKKSQGGMLNTNLTFDVYSDSNGLSYWVIAETGDSYLKGDLFHIEYGVPDKKDETFYSTKDSKD